jgi:tetratricopeptide (TPR) repeat protein
MKAATKKRGAAAARRAAPAKSAFPALPALSRRQWMLVAAVVVLLIAGVGSYFGWRAYANRPVNYESRLKTSPAYRSYTVGVAAAAGGRQKEAEDAFQRALSEDPSNALIYNALATLYITQGDVQKALVTSENGINSAPGSPDLYYTLGLSRYQTGQFDDAIRALDRALELKPNFPDALLWRGNTYLIQSKLGGAGDGGGDPVKLESAIADLRAATERADDVADYHAALAEALYQRRDLAEARTQMQRAVELDPNNAKYARSLGRVCDQLDDLDAAVAAFTTSTQHDPTDAEAFYGLGLAYFKKQQDADAIAAFRSALKINPFHVDAHEKLGQTLIRGGGQDEGQNELKLAEDSRVRAKKIDEMRRASAADPSNAELANNLGIELARQGDFEDAMQAFRRALAANPRMIDAQYQIGGLYAERGKWLEALTAFTTVDKMQQGYRRTNLYLSKINEKIGRKSEAEKRMKMFEEQEAKGEAKDS